MSSLKHVAIVQTFETMSKEEKNQLMKQLILMQSGYSKSTLYCMQAHEEDMWQLCRRIYAEDWFSYTHMQSMLESVPFTYILQYNVAGSFAWVKSDKVQYEIINCGYASGFVETQAEFWKAVDDECRLRKTVLCQVK